MIINKDFSIINDIDYKGKEMNLNETTVVYSVMKECFDAGIDVFEKCGYVGSDANDMYVEIELNSTFQRKLIDKLQKDKNYINKIMERIVLVDLADMLTVDNVPKEILKGI